MLCGRDFFLQTFSTTSLRSKYLSPEARTKMLRSQTHFFKKKEIFINRRSCLREDHGKRDVGKQSIFFRASKILNENELRCHLQKKCSVRVVILTPFFAKRKELFHSLRKSSNQLPEKKWLQGWLQKWVTLKPHHFWCLQLKTYVRECCEKKGKF